VLRKDHKANAVDQSKRNVVRKVLRMLADVVRRLCSIVPNQQGSVKTTESYGYDHKRQRISNGNDSCSLALERVAQGRFLFLFEVSLCRTLQERAYDAPDTIE